MSLFLLDDQLDVHLVRRPIQRWAKVQLLRELRPAEHVLDDRVPALLQTLHQPTFLTIDADFWNKRWCHTGYAILYFALRDNEQDQLPGLLRALLRRPEFRTRSRRMGKVVRVGPTHIDWWASQAADLCRVAWRAGGSSPSAP